MILTSTMKKSCSKLHCQNFFIGSASYNIWVYAQLDAGLRGLEVQDLAFRVASSRFRVSGSEFRFQGSRVGGYGCYLGVGGRCWAGVGRSHIETLRIYKLSLREFDTQNDVY